MSRPKGVGPVPTPETLPPNRREGGKVRGIEHVQNYGEPRSEYYPPSTAPSSARFVAESPADKAPSRDPAGLFVGVAMPRPKKK